MMTLIQCMNCQYELDVFFPLENELKSKRLIRFLDPFALHCISAIAVIQSFLSLVCLTKVCIVVLNCADYDRIGDIFPSAPFLAGHQPSHVIISLLVFLQSPQHHSNLFWSV